jgi:hypothetical protein
LSAKFVHEFPGTRTKRQKIKHPEGQNFQRKKRPETKRPCYKMSLGTKHPEGHNIILQKCFNAPFLLLKLKIFLSEGENPPNQ